MSKDLAISLWPALLQLNVFGLQNVPATFHRAMEQVLKSYSRFVVCYIDELMMLLSSKDMRRTYEPTDYCTSWKGLS